MKRKHRLASGCAAALVTCWSAAPTTAEAQLVVPNSADFTLSTNLSVAIDNVRFIYGFNASGPQNPFFVSVGLILAGSRKSLSFGRLWSQEMKVR